MQHMDKLISEDKIKRLYTLFIVLFPVISVYASFVPGFTAGDVLLALFFCLWVFIVGKSYATYSKTIMILMLPVMLSIVLTSAVSMIFNDQYDYLNSFIRIVRCEFYFFSVLALSYRWFDWNLARSYIVKLGLLGTAFVFIQYISFYIFNYPLRGFVPFFKVYHENYMTAEYYQSIGTMFRPTSFFCEPAHFSRYMFIPLVLTLFSDERSDIYRSIIFTVAILISTSGIGIMLALLCWGVWGFVRYADVLRKKGQSRIILAVFLLLLPIFLLFLFSNDSFISSIQRILTSKLNNTNTAGGARFRGYIEYFLLSPLFRVIGFGFGNIPETIGDAWFSGAASVLYGCGILGFAACLFLFVGAYIKNGNTVSTMLLIVYFLLFLMDDCFFSHVSVIYLSFILFMPKDLCNHTFE